MKTLIIDTETSGLFNFKLPADAPGQPRLAQFGAIMIDGFDAEPREIGMYVRPDGWRMEAEASAVNGLTDEFLEQHGTPVGEVLDAYEKAVRDGYVIAAYNAQYDTKVMRAEFRRAGRDDLFAITPNVCVMRPMMKLKIMKAAGGGGFPKLSDCCAHFGIKHENAHDAVGDARSAFAILRELHSLGLLPTPSVHYAKNRP